jgi:hypothetical protein
MTDTQTDRYSLAGWLAIVSAVLLVPEIGLAVFLGFISSGLDILVAPIHIVNLAIGIYILYVFRRLLNQQFHFRATDVLITVLILVNVVFFFVGLLELAVNTIGLALLSEHELSLVTMVLFVPFSLLTIVFGVVLLKLKDDLFGLLKPYAYTTIASGVCGATIILAPIGLLAAVAALVMLGMIFLRAKREAEFL